MQRRRGRTRRRMGGSAMSAPDRGSDMVLRHGAVSTSDMRRVLADAGSVRGPVHGRSRRQRRPRPDGASYIWPYCIVARSLLSPMGLDLLRIWCAATAALPLGALEAHAKASAFLAAHAVA